MRLHARWLVLGGIAMGVISVYSLHRSSFCFSDFRFRSDDEQMVTALESVVKKYRGKIIPLAQNNDIFLPYDSVDELLKRNQDCCKDVSSEIGNNYSHLDVLFGNVSRVYDIEYKPKRLIDNKISFRGYSIDRVPVSPCGEIRLE